MSYNKSKCTSKDRQSSEYGKLKSNKKEVFNIKHDPESESEHSYFEGIGKQETLGDIDLEDDFLKQ